MSNAYIPRRFPSFTPEQERLFREANEKIIVYRNARGTDDEERAYIEYERASNAMMQSLGDSND